MLGKSCEVTSMDGVRSEVMHSRVVMEKELASRVGKRVSLWFGYMERMDQ